MMNSVTSTYTYNINIFNYRSSVFYGIIFQNYLTTKKERKKERKEGRNKERISISGRTLISWVCRPVKYGCAMLNLLTSIKIPYIRSFNIEPIKPIRIIVWCPKVQTRLCLDIYRIVDCTNFATVNVEAKILPLGWCSGVFSNEIKSTEQQESTDKGSNHAGSNHL